MIGQINNRVAQMLLAKKKERDAQRLASAPGSLARLTHDNMADLGIQARPLPEYENEIELPALGGPTPIGRPQEIEDEPVEGLEEYPQPFTAPPTVEAQAPVVASRATAEDDDEAGARRMDANTALARGFETAGRQFLAGMTRTPVLDTLT
ncbi:MAG: hypothetical protein NTV51_03455, partial [Verrucomicrobia bacterium]|nr:hypothetical protein [Verrucomicrobiota bacterium]